MTNAATTTDPTLILAGIIRQVDGAHNLSADALARAILAHPGSRWGAAEPSINFRNLLSPEPGFELLPDDGDPERLPSDAQQLGGKWWVPRFGSASLAATFGAILERMVDAAHPTATFSELPAEGSRELYLSGDLVDDLIKKGTLDALVSEAEKLALGLLKLLQTANSAKAAPWPEPPSDRPKVEKTFYEYEIFDKNYITVADGIANSHKKARSKIQEYLAQHQNKTHHLELRRIEVLNTDALQCQQEQAEAAPLPIAPQAELPKDPPNAEDDGIPQAILPLERLQADLQRRRESQEVIAPTFPHISDSLMRSLICDIVAMLSDATEAALFGNQINPLEEIRARLIEILRLAAQDEKDPIRSICVQLIQNWDDATDQDLLAVSESMEELRSVLQDAP